MFLSAIGDWICMQFLHFTFKSVKNVLYTKLKLFSSIYIIFQNLIFIYTLSTPEIIIFFRMRTLLDFDV
jgi:hypothetical protein